MRTTPQHLAAEYRASGAWSEQRLGDLFADSAAVEPARIAIIDPPNRAALDGASPRRLDWRALSELVDATMVALADAGVRRDYFLTPQPLSARRTAEDHGLAYFHACDAASLAAALPAFFAPAARPALLEVETDMATNRRVFAEFRAMVARLTVE